jgi:hypothetical protein
MELPGAILIWISGRRRHATSISTFEDMTTYMLQSRQMIQESFMQEWGDTRCHTCISEIGRHPLKDKKVSKNRQHFPLELLTESKVNLHKQRWKDPLTIPRIMPAVIMSHWQCPLNNARGDNEPLTMPTEQCWRIVYRISNFLWQKVHLCLSILYCIPCFYVAAHWKENGLYFEKATTAEKIMNVTSNASDPGSWSESWVFSWAWADSRFCCFSACSFLIEALP